MSFYTYPVKTFECGLIDCKEIKNIQLLNLTKNFQKDINYQFLTKLVNDLISKNLNLNYIDKTIVLLNAYINSISTSINLQSKHKVKTSVNLNLILDNFFKNKINDCFNIFTYKNIKAHVSFPKNYAKTFTIYNFINKIELNNKTIDFHKLNFNEIDEIVYNLPDKLIFDIKNNYKLPKYNSFVCFNFMHTNNEIADYNFNFSINKIINLLKLIYTFNIKTFYDQQIFATTLLKLSLSDFDNITQIHFNELLAAYKNFKKS